MNKILLFGALFLFFVSCKDNNPQAIAKPASALEISSENWPKKIGINPQANTILKEWTEFTALDASFDALYNVKNREDLILVIEDLIEKQNLMEKSVYPEPFDKAQIKGREKVFKTFFLKIKGNLEYRLDTTEPVLETINAYNAFRNQFNVTVNSKLDTTLILDKSGI